MTRSESYSTNAEVLRARGYKRVGNSNLYEKTQHSRVYVFGEETDYQKWRYHRSAGTAWPPVGSGEGPSELLRFLQDPPTDAS